MTLPPVTATVQYLRLAADKADDPVRLHPDAVRVIAAHLEAMHAAVNSKRLA